MKRLVTWVLGAACLAALTASPATADPACDPTGDKYCIYTYQSTAANPNPLLGLTSGLPKGIFAIGPQGALNPGNLYLIVFDGNDANMDPFAGYIGISGADMKSALLGLVYDTKGDFNRKGGNKPLIAFATPTGIMVPSATSLANLGSPLLISLEPLAKPITTFHAPPSGAALTQPFSGSGMTVIPYSLIPGLRP